jgi:hypothetical protein
MSKSVHLPRWPRRWLLWIAAGLILRLLFIVFPRPFDDDTSDYLEFGHNLLHHGVYGITDGTSISPSLYRLPGYPIFLATFEQLFSHIWPNTWWNAVFLTQTFIDLAACLLLASFVRRHLSPHAAEITLALAALCPFTAVYCAIALTESLSIFAVALGIYAAGRAIAAEASGQRNLWAAALAGLAAALAMLLRPDGLILFVTLAGGIFWYGLRPPSTTRLALQSSRTQTLRALAPTLPFCVVALLPLVPWTVRNWTTFHVFQPLAPRYADPDEFTIAGARRWLRTWTVEYVSTANVCWNFPGDTIDLADLPPRAFDSADQRATTIALIQEYDKVKSLTPHLEAAFTALADERIRAHPFRYYITLPFLRIIDMLLRPRTEAFYLDVFWWRWSEHPGQTLASAFLGLVNFFYIATALLAFLRRRVPLPVMLGSFVVLRCMLLGIMENPEPRYTLVLFPVFVVAAAAALSSAESAPRTSQVVCAGTTPVLAVRKSI